MRVFLSTALVALTACARPRVLTTMNAKTTTEFWCSSTGECFTEKERCQAPGGCERHPHAWCSQSDDGYGQFVCGVSDGRCSDLALTAGPPFNNACVFQPKDGK